MSLTPQWLDELRTRITLSSVVGRTTRLTKAGREWKACCPFHNEKSPSFTVNDEKGFYHCFGCGAHGDAIRWMTDQRGLSFMDAVRELAAEANMEVPAADPRAAKQAEARAGLHEVMAAAQGWFEACLASPEGARARAYLATRGFDAQTCQRFGFGYAPEGRQAMKAALSQFPEELLIEAGLRIVVDEKDPYDRFRARLMLPIHDARGRVIAFGGRILDKGKSDAPKYLNSPDTPLFDKGRTLYNLHRAGPIARQTGRLVVVEGYMDAIALSAAGIGDCVAPLGTALTETQIELLWRQVETPVLCFDGDAAGQRAAMRALTRALPLLRPAHSLRITRMPAGMDPDDLLKRDGPRAMEQLLDGASTLIDTLWQVERDAAPLNTPEDKAGLKSRLMTHVETIADPDIKAGYRRELLDRFSAFAFPRKEFAPQGQSWQPGGTGQTRPRWNGRGAPPPPPRPLQQTAQRLQFAAQDNARAPLSAAIIAGLLRWPREIARNAETLAQVAHSDPRLEALLEHFESGGPLETGVIATILHDQGLAAPLPGDYAPLRCGFLAQAMDEAQAGSELAETIALLVERPAVEQALAEATARFERELSDGAFAEQQRLRKRKLEFDERLRHMAGAQDNSGGASTPPQAPNKMAD